MLNNNKTRHSVFNKKICILLLLVCLLSLLGCSTESKNNNSAVWNELPKEDQQTFIKDDGEKKMEALSDALDDYVNTH